MIKRIQSKLLSTINSEPSLLVPYAIETYAHCMVYHTKRWWRVNEDGWALCDDPRSMIKEYLEFLDLVRTDAITILPM
jgi:hypothetical protein